VIQEVALVTGAASGIGRAVAARLLARGARVFALDRDPAVATALEAAVPIVADVRSESDRARLCEQVGALDHLVNAAGVIRVSPIDEVTRADWDLVMEVNATALFFLTQALGKQMPAGSAIVNIASTGGKTASTTETAPYNASKAAVIALTKTFAYAYAPRGIRVNCVCPGNVETPMHELVLAGLAEARTTGSEDVEAAYNRTIPLGRNATPEEVAGVVAFLLSEDAAYMTGQAVNVSGGLVMY
jgi:NAD(P)-dependent dehydrogenase (short-subunit alcohol dehydrogenase family)